MRTPHILFLLILSLSSIYPVLGGEPVAVFEGTLSGDEAMHRVEVRPGELLAVNLTFTSIGGGGARVSAALLSGDGGMLQSVDLLLPSGGSVSGSMSYLFGATSDGVWVLLHSPSWRYAPSEVRYRAEARIAPLGDAGGGDAGHSREAAMRIATPLRGRGSMELRGPGPLYLRLTALQGRPMIIHYVLSVSVGDAGGGESPARPMIEPSLLVALVAGMAAAIAIALFASGTGRAT